MIAFKFKETPTILQWNT